jgi:hypothetical protein
MSFIPYNHRSAPFIKPHYIVSRVRFDGTAVYSATSLASTSVEYNGITGTALQPYLNGTNNFPEAHSDKIYRLAGGTTAGTYSIPLARITQLARVGAIAILTETATSANGTRTFSVGTPNNKTILLGNLAISNFKTPTSNGSSSRIWHPIGADGTASTCAESLTYQPNSDQPYLGMCMISPRTNIELYISDTDTITTGDITFIIYAEPLDRGVFSDVLAKFQYNDVSRNVPYQCIIPAY